MTNHAHLRDNGKKSTITITKNKQNVEVIAAANLWYITSVMDLGTVQKKKFQSEEMEWVRTCKIEFEFPKIKRTYWDGTEGNHIKWETMKISNYKSSSPEMSNSKLVDIMLALGSDALPADNDKCLSFIKKHLYNQPILIYSVTRSNDKWDTFDEIVKYEALSEDVKKTLPAFEPSLGNKYFDFANFSQDDFEELAPFHQSDIKKSPERLQKQAQPVSSSDFDPNELPF